ncbi:MAG: peptidase domain-containing ABC transporter [Sulfuritalea sp.]|nr:peptidase domain-containing ABC transporter [Sulfuritalea sp.]
MALTLIERLKALPDFASLSDAERATIAKLAEPIHLPRSATVVAQGERPAGLYHVVAGEIRLTVNSGADRQIIDTLREGAFFCQQALDDAEPMLQSAVVGGEPALLQFISRDTFARLLVENTALAERIGKARRTAEVTGFLAGCASFRDVPREALIELADRVTLRELRQGDLLIEQGARDDVLYIVRKGELVVTRREAPSHRIALLGERDVVGEMAVLSGEQRIADVTADTAVTVYALPGEDFRGVAAAHAALTQRLGTLIEERRSAVLTDPDSVVVAPADQDGASSHELTAPHSPASSSDTAQGSGFIKLLKRLWPRSAKPPAIRQHSEMDCSAACLSTVCRFYGKEVSINTTREIARVRQEGASMASIIRAAREMGFQAAAYESTIEQLREKRLPAIANWRGYHWIVIHQVTADQVLIADPAEGLVTYSIAEFLENWAKYTIFLEPTPAFDAFPESRTSLLTFLPIFTPFKKTIIDIFVASFLLQLLSVLTPLFSKFVIDDIILPASTQWLTAALVVMVSVLVLKQILTFLRNEMVLRVSMKCNAAIIGAVYQRLLSLPIGYFEARKTGDITSRLEQNEEITNFVTEDGLETFLSLFSVVVYLSVMLYFNVLLTLAAVSFLLLNIVLIAKISPRIRQINRETFVKEADLESHLIESLRGARTLKTIGADHLARWQYENNFAAVANMKFREAKFAQLAGLLSGTLDALSDVAVLLLGGAFVIMGKISLGELVAFTAFANSLQEPINKVVGKWDELQEVVVAVERLNDIMEKKSEFGTEGKEAPRLNLPKLRGHVEFRNVAFRYNPDDPNNVVQNVNLVLPPGKKVAFVGASGSGKSTLIKLLYGFYPASSGKILIDGFDLAEASLETLRHQIAMVPQKSTIYQGTVRDNIALANPGATLEQVQEAAIAANAHDFIVQMPGGYTAQLEESGANLSGGQRQRIAIARAFLQPAAILVLDEATSALDNETERNVMENISAHYGDRSVIMIAHRLSTVRNVDLIVVLERGIIVESGTHDDLMAKRGVYYHLSARQLEQD